MDNGRRELIKIKEVLKANPRGLSLTGISRLVNMNRHSVAKYMEMMTISGQVEKRSFGPSKMYFLSQRVPISAMLSFSSDMICMVDRDMKIIQINDAFVSFFGYDRGYLLGQNVRELGDDFPVNPGIIALIEDALNGRAHQYNMNVCLGEETRYVKMKLIPTAFDDGTTGVVFIGEDITAEKLAEQALQASKDALEKQVRMTAAELERSNSMIRAVLDILPISVIVVDAKTARISYVGPGITRYYGKNLEGRVMDARLDGLTILKPDRLPLDDTEIPMIRALRNAETIDMAEYILQLKDNAEMHVLINSAPVYGPGGEITAAVSTIMDITGLKMMEKRAAEATKLLQVAMRASPLAINAVDLDLNVILWNRKAEEVFGWKADEVIGRPLPMMSGDRESDVEAFRAMVRSGQFVQGINVVRTRKDGTPIDLIVFSSPLHDENGRLFGALGFFYEAGAVR